MAAQPPQGPPHPRRRSAFRAAASAVVVGLVVLLSLSPAVADAEPPNLAAVPSAVPEARDSAVPAPPIPQLSTIPVRSRIQASLVSSVASKWLFSTTRAGR